MYNNYSFVLIILIIEMKFPVCFISLITICIISKIYSQKTKDPGCSACTFFGTTPERCGEIVPAASLPPECTSLFFYWLHSDPKTLDIIDHSDVTNYRERIKELDATNKPVFIYYGQNTIEDWMTILNGNTKDGGAKAQCEMQKLKFYLGQFKNIAGLIIVNLYPQPTTKCISDMTENFKIYLDEMKKAFPDFGIGVEIIGKDLVDSSANPPACVDFKVVDTSIDFYLFDLYFFNDCTEDLRVGGATPINGKKARTLEQLVSVAETVGFSKSKNHFVYRSCSSPIKSDNMCNETNTAMCAKATNTGFCSDNTQSFYEKGKFAKTNGVGFVMINVDIADDPNGKCNCGTPFPAFHDVLAGFKNLPAPKPCPLLDKC